MAEIRNGGLRIGAELQVKEISSLQVKSPGDFRTEVVWKQEGAWRVGRDPREDAESPALPDSTYFPFFPKYSESQASSEIVRGLQRPD